MRTRHLLLLALLGLALWLTRWQGLPILLAVALTLPRWRDRLAVALPSVLIMGLAVAFSGQTWRMFGYATLNVLPARASEILTMTPMAAGCLGLLPLLVFLLWYSEADFKPLIAATIAYPASLLIAAVWFQMPQNTDLRLMVGGICLLVLLACAALLRRRLWGKLLVCGVALSILVIDGQQLRAVLSDQAAAFNSRAWRESSALRLAKVLSDSGQAVWSNAPDLIWWQTGKLTKRLPGRYDTLPGRELPQDSGGVLFWFKGIRQANTPECYARWIVRDSAGKPMITDNKEATVMMIRGEQP